ncbi:MAG: divergent polysaccharide deacetylase family protein [Candidatus Eiseniibacteriota bacterium]
MSAALFAGVHRMINPDAAGAAAAWQVDRAMDDVFRAEGVDRTGFVAQVSHGAPAEIRVPVPNDASITRLNAQVTRAVEAAGAHVFEALETGPDPDAPEAVDLRLGMDRQVTHRVMLRQEPARAEADTEVPRIAVVFDDLGYTMDGLAADLLRLPVRLTFAILPGLPETEEFARAAKARGHDVILHIPMEPMDPRRHDPGRDALLVDLEPEENLRRLRSHLDGFSGYCGVSNHMGSRFTSDPELMELVLGEIRRRDGGLFFLDSSTTPYSVVGVAARSQGLAHLRNNVFLDGGDEGPESARVRTDRVAEIARREGQAVAIGHVHRETVDAVLAAIDRWNDEGIRLVGISELMHR